MTSKYRNKICICDGYKFHSQLERDFYLACKAWKQEGKIFDFRMQVKYNLVGSDGKTVVCSYILDFEIYDNAFRAFDGKGRYVEAKGVWLPISKLKKKLFEIQIGKLETHTAQNPWKP